MGLHTRKTSSRLRPLLAATLCAGLALGAWAGGARLAERWEAPAPDAQKTSALKVQPVQASLGWQVKSVAPETLAANAAILEKVRKAWAASRAEKEAVLEAQSFDSRFGSSAATIRTAHVESNGRLALNAPRPATFEEAKPAEQKIADAAASAILMVSAHAAARSSGVEMKDVRPAAVADASLDKGEVQVASLETDAMPDIGTTDDEKPQLWQLPDRALAPVFRPQAKIAPEPADHGDETDAEPAKPAPAQRKAPAVLAYAKPDDPLEESRGRASSIPWPTRGNRTAVYDISAATVYMPNGEKLEAHSGRGEMRDNPKFTHVTMRGPTPPATYNLKMRESRFHGVEAIRLNPVDGKAPQGRVGLLAHTYLLRVRGDSSGCVVFKDYNRFLAAFKRGEVDRMVVVASMNGKGPSLASRVASIFTPSRSR